jgi:uncharacterized protein (DUF58 family)
MTLRPGRNLLWLAAAGVMLSAAAFYVPAAAWLLIPLLIAAVALAIYDGVWLRRHRADLVVSRDIPQVAGRDVPFDVTLRCVNKGLGRIRGSLREVAPSEAAPRWWTADFPPQGITGLASFRQSFRIATRGRFEFGPAWVRVVGPWSMLEGLWEVAGHSRIKIYPEGLVAQDDLSQHLAAEIQVLDRRSKARRRSAGTDFESIHEYRAGDDPRRIDWRTTARTRRLVVRRFQVEQHQDVLILIDCGRLMGAAAGRGSKLDCAVDSALLLARVALSNGDRCGVALFDSQVAGFLTPRSSMAAFHTVVESVYDAQSRWQETDFASMFAHLQSRQHKRSVIIVLSDVGDEETSRRARVAMASLAARHVVIFAALQTPLLSAQTCAPIKNRLDAARHAVAYRLLREREQTLHAFRRGNVQVLDVEPGELTIPLINRYLELRSRNVV